MRIHGQKPYEDPALINQSVKTGKQSVKTGKARPLAPPKAEKADGGDYSVSINLTVPEEEIRSRLVAEARKAIADGSLDTPESIARAADAIWRHGL